jgi:hypothetical protein
LNVTEKHFFKDCDEIFDIKQQIFQEDYLGKCLLFGDALNHTPLHEVDLQFNSSDHNKSFYLRLLNFLLTSSSLIHISSHSAYSSLVEFDIFYINNYQEIEDFYCIKKTLDFGIEGVMLYQIFDVKVKSLDMLNDFWITYE